VLTVGVGCPEAAASDRSQRVWRSYSHQRHLHRKPNSVAAGLSRGGGRGEEASGDLAAPGRASQAGYRGLENSQVIARADDPAAALAVAESAFAEFLGRLLGGPDKSDADKSDADPSDDSFPVRMT